jgi:hypothetical protein
MKFIHDHISYTIIALALLVIALSIMLASETCSAQNKPGKLAPTDTLVSRTQMIAKIRSDMDQIQKNTEQTLLILRGQLSVLEVQTSDSIRVKK